MKNDRSIIRRIIYYMNPERIDPDYGKAVDFFPDLNVIFFLLPRDMVEGSILIMAPLAGLFVYALTTKDVMSSLCWGLFYVYLMV